MAERLDKFWVGVAAALLAATLAGAAAFFLLLHSEPGLPITVSSPQAGLPADGLIYVGGAISNPGLYPLQAGDTIEEVLAAAGGPKAEAANGRLRLEVNSASSLSAPQKIDINRAEAWILEALPGIGPASAQAIVEHRARYGPFRMTQDLLQVRGIGETTYHRLKDYVVVED